MNLFTFASSNYFYNNLHGFSAHSDTVTSPEHVVLNNNYLKNELLNYAAI